MAEGEPPPEATVLIRRELVAALSAELATEQVACSGRVKFWRAVHWSCVGLGSLGPLALTALNTVAPTWVLGSIGFLASAAALWTGSGRTGERQRRAEETGVALLGVASELNQLRIQQQSTDAAVLAEVDRQLQALRQRLGETRAKALVAPPDLSRLAAPPS